MLQIPNLFTGVEDRIKETTATAGVGTITLGGAFLGYNPVSTIGNANQRTFTMDDGLGNWETFLGTYTAAGNLLSRDMVLSGSNGTNHVSFGAGAKTVRLDLTAGMVAGFGYTTLSITDPTTSTDFNNQYLDSITLTSTGKNNNPNFSNCTGFIFNHECYSGWNWNNSGNNALAKLTFLTDSKVMDAFAQGQHQISSEFMNCYGQGDAIVGVRQLNFYGGIGASGDEGQNVESVQCVQGSTLAQTHINTVTKATINTTTTQVVTGSRISQTVNVVSTTGVSINQYVLIDPAAYSSATFGDCEAVLVTAFTATSLTGIFRRNHLSGAIIIGATVLRLNNNQGMGEGRILVNRTATSYSTGTAVSAGSRDFTGAGTTWTTGLPGTSALNQGAISFAADDQTVAPFGTGFNRLTCWYMIASVNSNTSLTVFHRSAVGTVAYSGLQTVAGAYQMSPAAIIMAKSALFDTDFVLSPDSFTWTPNDLVECAISVEAEVTGVNLRLWPYTPGATFRSGYDISNLGLVPFSVGLNIHSSGNQTPYAFATGLSISDAFTAIALTQKDLPGAVALTMTPNQGANIVIGNIGNPGFYYNPTTHFMEWVAGLSGNTVGTLQQAKIMPVSSGVNSCIWQFGGGLALKPPASGTDEITFAQFSHSLDQLVITPSAHRFTFSVQYPSGTLVEIMRMENQSGANGYLSFFGNVAIQRPVLPTSSTTAQIITMLQNYGLCTQT